LLGATQDVPIALALCHGLHRRWFDPACGSVSVNQAKHSPLTIWGLPLGLLRCSTESHQRQDRQRVRHAQNECATRISARDFLDCGYQGDGIGVASAESLRRRHSQQADIGHFSGRCHRKGRFATPLGRIKRELGPREVARQRANRVLVSGQLPEWASCLTGCRVACPA